MVDSILLRLAKITILSKFRKDLTMNKEKLCQAYGFLNQKGATFVTLNSNHNLRGCIGSLVAHRLLIDDVMHNAYAAAFNDTRFNQLEEREFDNLTLEVSVLSEPQEIEYANFDDLVSKVTPLKDGLILKHPKYQGTFLPQVWRHYPTPKDFLLHLSQKAGATPSIFKEHPQILKYRVESIEEDFNAILPL